MRKLGLKIIGIVCLVQVIIAVIFSASYVYIFDKVENQLKNDVSNCVVEATKIIDADKVDKIIKDNLVDGPEQSEVLNSMLLFKSKQNVKNLYLFTKKDEKTALFVIDASSDPADFLEEYDMEPEMLNTFNGTLTVCDEAATDEWGTFLSAYAPIKDSSGQVIAIVGADSDVKVFQDIKSEFLIALIVAIGLALVVSLIITLLFSRRLRKNINIIKTSLKRMSNGDLTGTINVKTKDEIEEIGYALTDFKTNISNTLNNIRENVDNTNIEAKMLSKISSEMSLSAKNVSSVIEEVAQSSNNQASDLTSINKAFSDFGQDIESIVNLIKNIDTSVNDITVKSKEGSNNINLILDFIGQLSFQLNQVTERIKGLGDSVNKINEITNLINSIADQTNLLALNASIEAARAGEAGRGFSVVADEIGKLAEQSKISSKNINILLKNLSLESNEVVVNTENVNSQMMKQTNIMNGVGVSLKDIMIGIEKILPEIHSVNNSLSAANNIKGIIVGNLENSSASVEEISASSQEIASSSEELSTATEQVALASDKLSHMMNTVANNINKFKTE